MTTQQPTRAEEISKTSLWFGFTGSALVWFAYLAVAWAFVEFGCRLDNATYSTTGMESIQILVIVATVIALVISVASLVVAFRIWRAVGRERPSDFDEDFEDRRIWQRTHFMAKVGTLMGLLFTATILLTFVPVFVLETCGGILG